jgi:hypothetical protein
MPDKMRPCWIGTVPERDDFDDPITTTFIDGRTVMGPWAIMTPRTHKMRGVGLGTGRGQRYVKEADGTWYKVEG